MHIYKKKKKRKHARLTKGTVEAPDIRHSSHAQCGMVKLDMFFL